MLTVTNLDNGKATTCLVAGNQRCRAAGWSILLDAAVFQDVADLVEAPVPVRVAWTARRRSDG